MIARLILVALFPLGLTALAHGTEIRANPHSEWTSHTNRTTSVRDITLSGEVLPLLRVRTPEWVVAPGSKLERVAGGFRFAESPLWRPGGTVLVSDVAANTIWEVDTRTGGVTPFRAPSNWANGQAGYGNGGVITAEHGGSISKTDAEGTRVELLTAFNGKRLNSPDDLTVSPDGVVYFTDPPFGFWKGMGAPGRTPELGFAGVYRWDPRNHTITVLARDLIWPNGIALSPDASTLYVSDSKTQNIYAFALNPSGQVAARSVLIHFTPQSMQGVVDGLKVDAKGRIFAAVGKGIGVISPAGHILLFIPAQEFITNLAFGDSDDRTLYVSGRSTLYKLRLETPGIRW